LLAACSDIPTSGPVVGGNPVRAQDSLPFVAFGPAEPREGAEPAAIVDGFIDAMSAYQPGYEIAKLFLTPEALATWDPSAGITVHRGTRPSIEVLDEDRVQLTMTVTGEVREDGSFGTVESDGATKIELLVDQVDGEWRIADPPQGTIISEDNFAREYESHNLCFFEPGGEVFVFDPVYVPKSGQTATLLTQMLLAGPSRWLEPAVRSAFPETVTLSVASVPIDSGTATVDLSANAQEIEPVRRTEMAAQLGCTLAGLPEVSRVAMNADGIALLGQDESTVTATVPERHDPNLIGAGGALYAIREGGLVRGNAEALQPVQGALGAADDITEVAVEAGGSRAVVVAGFGAQLQTAAVDADSRRTLFEGTSISSPSWARNNIIWAVNHGADGGELLAVTADGADVEVRAAELDDRDVQRISVSPDGTRMALVADGTAYLALVVFDGDDRDHVSIERLRRIGPDVDVLDVSWSGAERVAMLVHDQEDPEILVVDTFGAVQASRGTVAGGILLAAGADQRLVVATETGNLLEHESRTRWIELGEGTAPAYP
jgi:hypothetical protein